jgi:hypothetical protein
MMSIKCSFFGPKIIPEDLESILVDAAEGVEVNKYF